MGAGRRNVWRGDGGFAFPNLYRLWKRHDLALHRDLGSIRPSFYEGLKPEDEPKVWRFIEENYLLRYREFLGIRFDWSSSGLWLIPFPGSVGYGPNVGDLAAFGIPEHAGNLLKAWHDPLDALPYDPDDGGFDWEASDRRGLAAAGEVKRAVGSEVYVEFKPFREIVFLADGTPEQLPVPAFIKDLTGGEPLP